MRETDPMWVLPRKKQHPWHTADTSSFPDSEHTKFLGENDAEQGAGSGGHQCYGAHVEPHPRRIQGTGTSHPAEPSKKNNNGSHSCLDRRHWPRTVRRDSCGSTPDKPGQAAGFSAAAFCTDLDAGLRSRL